MPRASPLDVVKRLIAFDTTSRNSNLALIEFAAQILEGAGAQTRLTYDDNRSKANLFATLGPERDGGYVLSGHTDVVPVDGQDWSSDPFAPTLKDGKLYGRGAADMKGFIGTALALAEEFRELDLNRPIHFALSYDEEVGCIGVRRLLEDLAANNIRPALALIGEPTMMRVVGAHKSGSVIETVAVGREGHSSAPAAGASAVMMTGEFIALLSSLGRELMDDRDEHFDPPYTTMQANLLSGGTAVNVLAKEARVLWEIRGLPDRDAASLVERVEDRANAEILPRYRSGAPEARFRTHVRVAYPGLVRDVHSPAVQLACQVLGENDVFAVAYGTEAGLFQQAGLSAVICGPGSIGDAHRADEFVSISQLDACESYLRRVGRLAAQ